MSRDGKACVLRSLASCVGLLMVTEGKPDRPDLHDILNSIRRLTLEERAPDILAFGPDIVIGAPADERQTLTDPEDFELPAMFRPVHVANEQRRSNVMLPWGMIERLSDAPPQDGRTEPTFNSAVTGAIAAAAAGETVQPPPLRTDDLPREMPPCRDRTIARMGQSNTSFASQASTIPSIDAHAPDTHISATGPSGARAVPKATLRNNFLVGAGSLVESNSDEESSLAVDDALRTGSQTASPSPLPEGAADKARMDLAGADILRPLLRQWLDENVSRVLAQALMETIRGKDRGS
jgi:cell pole-organizing protein PopZ